jgi:3-oxoacyl-[acyl-carrier protein] reductase
VRVLGIAPSVTLTDEALEALVHHAETASGVTGTKVTADDVVNKYLEKIPLRRSAEPDDMAVVAAFCVSDLASFVSGSFIPVDGGYLAV